MINKSVIVTGASKGIGAATAYLLAKNKFNVAIIYKSSDKEAKKVLKKCNNYSNCILIKADVTNDKDCKKIVKETEKKLGPINILINNAGKTKFVNPSVFQSYIELNSYVDQFRLDTNVHEAFFYDPKEGKMVTFPSHVIHEVRRNESDDDRIAVSYNITLAGCLLDDE